MPDSPFKRRLHSSLAYAGLVASLLNCVIIILFLVVHSPWAEERGLCMSPLLLAFFFLTIPSAWRTHWLLLVIGILLNVPAMYVDSQLLWKVMGFVIHGDT